MYTNNLFINTENYTSSRIKPINNSKFSYTMPNLKNKISKKKNLSNHLKFNNNILLNLLKKSNLKKKRFISQTHSKITFNSFNDENINSKLTKDIKILYNLNKKFHDLPGLSKFHNLTNEKMNNLIKTEENSYNLIKTYQNKKSQINLKIKERVFDNIELINNKRYLNDKNIIIVNNKNDFLRHSLGAKKFKLNVNKLKKSTTTNLYTNSSSSNQQNEKASILDKISHEKKIKLIKNNTNNTQIWMAPLKSSSNRNILRRGSIVDRLVFYIEKPEECFEENLLDKKPGDKYQLFKNQLTKHKNKLENIIKEIRLNQIKSEYLMKKYIFELLSKKKKVY